MKAYTVAIGEFKGPFAIGKQRKVEARVIEMIKKLEGKLGVSTVPGRGTLILFRRKNDAIRAKNVLDAEGVKTGTNIGECEVPDEYVNMVKW